MLTPGLYSKYDQRFVTEKPFVKSVPDEWILVNSWMYQSFDPQWNVSLQLGLWANPLYHGDYPEIVKERVGNRSRLEGRNQSRLPSFTEEEKKLVKGTSDFFCVNIYDSALVTNMQNDPIVEPPSILGDVGVEFISVNNVSCSSSSLQI